MKHYDGGGVAFRLAPAVPHPAMCADEVDCSFEKITLCAFDEAGAGVGDRLPFLECMDRHKLPLFYNDTVPRSCAERVGLDWIKVEACFSGSQGDTLIAAAQREVSFKIGNASFALPLVQVQDKTVCSGTDCSYAAVSAHLPGAAEDDRVTDDGGGGSEPSIGYYFASK